MSEQKNIIYNDGSLTPDIRFSDGGNIIKKTNMNNIDDFTDEIRDFLNKNATEYLISNGGRSKTDFGNSNYLYAILGTVNDNKSIKIRISDHSVSNYDRIFNEIHIMFSYNELKESDFTWLIKEINFRLQREKYFTKEYGFEDYTVSMEVNENGLRPTDKIMSERLSSAKRGAGRKIYNIERVNKKPIIKWINKNNNKVYKVYNKLANGGVLVDEIDEVKVCDKLYQEHHNTWDKVDVIEKGVTIENTKKYSDEIALMWVEHMEQHFADEEQNFFPYVKEDDKKAVEYLLLEHKAIIDLIQEIKQHNKLEDILKFCAMIKNHIKKEEVLMNDVCPDTYVDGGNVIGTKKTVILYNNTNSAYDRDAQAIIMQYLKNLNDSGRTKFLNDLKKLGQNWNEFDVYFYINQNYHPKHTDKFYSNKLVYRDSAKDAYKDALNGDDENPNYIRIWRKDGVAHYIAVPQASLFGDYIGDMYDDNGNLKQEVKDLAISELIKATNTELFADGGSIDNLFYKQAVKEVIGLPAYSDLSQKDGEFLYDTFKNYESLYDEDYGDGYVNFDIEKPELEGDKLKDYRDFLEELENKKYINDFYDSDNTINSNQITINFINSVRGRIETLSNYKSNSSDLFNESINIEETTEPESKLKEISGWNSSISFNETKANYTRSIGEKKANYVVADYFGVEPLTLSRFNDYNEKTGSYPLDYKKEFSTVEEAIEYANDDINKHLLVKRKEVLAKKDEYIKEIKSYVLLSKDSKKYNNNLRSLYAEYFNEVVCYNPELWMELQELFIDSNIELRKDVFLAPFTTDYDRFELQSILDFYQNLDMLGKHDFWSLIPEKFVSNLPVNKKQLTTLDPFDSVFMSIFGLFTSDNKDRPNIQGVNFDDFGVTANNGSKLIHIPYSEKYKSKLRGIYNLKDNKQLKSINAINKPHQYKGLKYPNYNAVIPSIGSETIIYSFTMDELNKLINELKTLSKANCNSFDSRLIFVAYLKDLGYKYINMSMFIDDLYAASMMGSRKIEICFPSINSMFISDDVIAFANGRKSKRIISRQTIRENWGILQQVVKSIEAQEFCHYDFDKKHFVNPNLNEATTVKVDTYEVDALNERLELVKEMLAEDNSNESLKDRVELLQEMIEEKSKLAEGGNYNPYAVCTTSIGKTAGTQKISKWNKKQMKKYEDCVLSFEEGGSLIEDTYLGFYDRDTKELKATVFIDKQNIGSKTHIRLIDNATDKNMFAKRIDKEVHENFLPEIETKKTQDTGLSKDKLKAVVKNEGIVYAVADYLSGSEISLYEKTLRQNWIEANKEIYHLDKLIESLPKVHVLKEIQDENGFHFIIESYVTEVNFDEDLYKPNSKAIIESLEKIKVTLRKITDELGLNVMGSENGEEFGKGGKLGGCGCGH